jgi:hypothetical protein
MPSAGVFRPEREESSLGTCLKTVLDDVRSRRRPRRIVLSAMSTDGNDRKSTSSELEWPPAERKLRWGSISETASEIPW